MAIILHAKDHYHLFSTSQYVILVLYLISITILRRQIDLDKRRPVLGFESHPGLEQSRHFSTSDKLCKSEEEKEENQQSHIQIQFVTAKTKQQHMLGIYLSRS